MNIAIDIKPTSNTNPRPFFAIRLFPQNNEEMGEVEWGMSVMGEPERIERVCNGTGDKSFHYVILFKEKDA